MYNCRDPPHMGQRQPSHLLETNEKRNQSQESNKDIPTQNNNNGTTTNFRQCLSAGKWTTADFINPSSQHDTSLPDLKTLYAPQNRQVLEQLS